MKNWLYLVLAGLISGVVGGMGMGGGTLLIPVLTIFLSFAQKDAQAINLLAFIPMSIFALIVHIKNKLVDFKVGIPIILIGTCFSIGGSMLANSLSNEFLRKIFGVFLLLVGLNQILQTVLSIKKNKDNGAKPKFKFRILIK